jgi:hypothetical protein
MTTAAALKRHADQVHVQRVRVVLMALVHAEEHGDPACLLCQVVADYRAAEGRRERAGQQTG